MRGYQTILQERSMNFFVDTADVAEIREPQRPSASLTA